MTSDSLDKLIPVTKLKMGITMSIIHSCRCEEAPRSPFVSSRTGQTHPSLPHVSPTPRPRPFSELYSKTQQEPKSYAADRTISTAKISGTRTQTTAKDRQTGTRESSTCRFPSMEEDEHGEARQIWSNDKEDKVDEMLKSYFLWKRTMSLPILRCPGGESQAGTCILCLRARRGNVSLWMCWSVLSS